ncbi:MAG: LysM peptidoglycan-binding domain-containing protein [Anaerolineae bacterium]|nr:LysM peptidoglycan-binding domain-containing protein [Anaerolineae bacterium]
MRRYALLILIVLLSACFKDASEERRNPTTVNVQTLDAFQRQSVQESPSATASTAVATLTPTPRTDPTETFPVGGPPINQDENDETTTEPTTQLSATTATQGIASFTPSGSTFGDPGITATPISTQPIPNALITPTDFVQQTECVYSVQANDTLFSIATQFSVTVDEFIAVNPVLSANPNALSIGQNLSIPNCIPEGQGGGITETTSEAVEISPTSSAAVAEGTNTHTVAQGETLFRIAIQYNTSVEAILAANPEMGGSTIIYPGQVLVIPQGN